jgi:hypothetical protein
LTGIYGTGAMREHSEILGAERIATRALRSPPKRRRHSPNSTLRQPNTVLERRRQEKKPAGSLVKMDAGAGQESPPAFRVTPLGSSLKLREASGVLTYRVRVD